VDYLSIEGRAEGGTVRTNKLSGHSRGIVGVSWDLKKECKQLRDTFLGAGREGE